MKVNAQLQAKGAIVRFTVGPRKPERHYPTGSRMSSTEFMRAVVQRVSRARVTVDAHSIGQIERGLLVLLGVGSSDGESDAEYLAEKIAALRIFEDAEGKMNRNVSEAGGAVLAVSQFTLYGDARRGKRPSFDAAARPEQARGLYEYFVERVRVAWIAMRNREIPSRNESRAGERRTGDDPAGLAETLLTIYLPDNPLLGRVGYLVNRCDQLGTVGKSAIM